MNDPREGQACSRRDGVRAVAVSSRPHAFSSFRPLAPLCCVDYSPLIFALHSDHLARELLRGLRFGCSILTQPQTVKLGVANFVRVVPARTSFS
jgi:hypothetical protein